MALFIDLESSLLMLLDLFGRLTMEVYDPSETFEGEDSVFGSPSQNLLEGLNLTFANFLS